MTHKQTIISSAIAINVLNGHLTSYSNGRRKEGAKCRTLGQKDKGQPFCDFLVALIF